MPTYHWTLAGRTCEAGGNQPITLHLSATLSDEGILTALTMAASGPGVTCGAKWSPTWAERAVDKLGWLGRPLDQLVAPPPPADPFGCACTEISLAPKLWRLLQPLGSLTS